MDDVIDVNKSLVTQEEKDLFAEKKKFMHSVFERTLQPDQGKTLVRHNDSTFEAQAIYKALIECYEKNEKTHLC